MSIERHIAERRPITPPQRKVLNWLKVHPGWNNISEMQRDLWREIGDLQGILTTLYSKRAVDRRARVEQVGYEWRASV